MTRSYTKGSGALLDAQAAVRKYRDLEVIFREGDPGNEMYVIRSGRVKLTKKVQGIVANIATLGPAEFFAEMALFADQPRSATATADGKVELIVYDKGTLIDAVKADPAIALKMLEAISQRIRKIDEEVARLIVKGLLPADEAHRIRRYTFASTW